MNRKLEKLLLLFLCAVMLFPALPAFAVDVDYETEVTEEDTKGIVNVLLLGTDDRIPNTKDKGRADCIIIASFNKSTGDIKLISIERAIYIDIPNVGKDLITYAHSYGGPEMMVDLIEKNFNIDLAGYCEVDFQQFINIIDTLCGVDITLTEPEETGLNGLWNELCPDNVALTMHDMVEGENHLDGYDALMYCRLRCIDSDWYRIERQRNLIQAVLDTALDFDLQHNITAVKAILPYVDTNLSARDICALIACVGKFTGTIADQMSVPVKTEKIDCDYAAESIRIHDFIYGAPKTENAE